MAMIRRMLEIQNVAGLHARAAAKLVQTCEKFKSDIKLAHGRVSANAKSIMGVMMLAAECGAKIKVTAKGRDAAKAMDAIAKLMNNKFGEGK